MSGFIVNQQQGRLSIEYLDPALTNVRNWINAPTCGQTVSADPAWLPMSIVNDGTYSPTYSYPNTAMAAYLCQSVQNPNNVNCSNYPASQVCPNNTSTQGQLFYGRITSGGVTPNSPYSIYAVRQCYHSEGVTGDGSDVPGFTGDPHGWDAVDRDMKGNCISRH